jgi:hypothetical protein
MAAVSAFPEATEYQVTARETEAGKTAVVRIKRNRSEKLMT